jgi:hypothetical protein
VVAQGARRGRAFDPGQLAPVAPEDQGRHARHTIARSQVARAGVVDAHDQRLAGESPGEVIERRRERAARPALRRLEHEQRWPPGSQHALEVLSVCVDRGIEQCGHVSLL